MVKKQLSMLFCITITALSLFGCQSGAGVQNTQNDVNIETNAGQEPGSQVESEDDGSITGQVKSIDGNSIMLALTNMPQRDPEGGGQQPLDGELPNGEAPNGEFDETGTPPEKPDGGEQPGSGGNAGGPGGLTLTGEEMTITGSEGTVYTIDEMGQSAEGALSDIEEGSIIKVVMDGETVTSVTIMNQGQKGSPPAPEGMTEGDETSQSGETTQEEEISQSESLPK